MDIIFKDSKGFSLGVEIEMQLVDRDTLSLTRTSTEIIEGLKGLDGSVKHELTISNLEVISGVCQDVREVGEDLKNKLRSVIAQASQHNTRLCLAGTHPFSRWRDQDITDDERYQRLLKNLQMVARRFNIFGLHVHVGINGGERCIYIMNKMLYYLPHLLALSTNSPFWQGQDTGLKSYRVQVFETLPSAGLPFYFHNWSDYTSLVSNYIKTGTIETIRELWWDIRPHPDFGTLEIRICDIPSTIEEVLGITALIQALVKRFSDEFDCKVPFERPHSAITRENKWRASRYGIDGAFINEDGGSTIPVKEAISRLVKSLKGVAGELGSTDYLESIENILDNGTGAHRQIRVWRKSGELKDVVTDVCERLINEVCAQQSGQKGGRS